MNNFSQNSKNLQHPPPNTPLKNPSWKAFLKKSLLTYWVWWFLSEQLRIMMKVRITKLCAKFLHVIWAATMSWVSHLNELFNPKFQTKQTTQSVQLIQLLFASHFPSNTLHHQNDKLNCNLSKFPSPAKNKTKFLQHPRISHLKCWTKNFQKFSKNFTEFSKKFTFSPEFSKCIYVVNFQNSLIGEKQL